MFATGHYGVQNKDGQPSSSLLMRVVYPFHSESIETWWCKTKIDGNYLLNWKKNYKKYEDY